MVASDALSTDQFPQMGDRFAHRHMLRDGARKDAAAADPDNPKHYDKYEVTQVHARGSVSYKPYPTRKTDRAKMVSPEKFSEIAIAWPKRT